jgi:quercetin dioxygenase-like cupin family protein
MIVDHITNFKGGWFIGDFLPSIHKTSEFEVGILSHKQGEEWPTHYHTGTEINYLVSGEMMIQSKILRSGDIFKINPYEIANPEFITDCTVVVVKTPSVPGDKYLAEKPKNV